ncbi:cysteine desulfurase [Leuconostoc carnosum]|uniref:Cysteine desulfurase n=2 Tax=Leuconostoc carnosum TaxID=1252 RepID=K0DAN5_LEUCJ|nr:cysteine desulfurase [Leuconostoc carnosum]AFT81878.1 hypothetical protein C270_04835 [Leuconostoc carnosum JB16]KAA8328458.1 cysteine desulfurase [Leuconostoc carnosum]KAA8371016.1 cysteine desulfurase [Leuconostoc carnosum]KAA8382659.1 cysteine desulfurase [Leuconostoc carnosum]QEA32647.1 cysteine desulfurase [Leuconostoc carnosum]
MAFDKQVTIPSDGTYKLSENIKKYTLGDLGFVTNPAGVHVLHRALEPEKALNNAIQLKISINRELTGFKISTVSAGDVVRVDIFKNKNADEIVTLYRFFMDELMTRGVLERVNND